MDNGSQVEMTIKRMPYGGYLVFQGYPAGDRYMGSPIELFAFAATSIDDALGFIRDKVKPTDTLASQAG